MENTDITEITCLENILKKLTSVIQMYEFEDTENLIKLCDSAVSITAQLDYIRNHYKEDEYEEDYEELEDE